MGAGKRVFPGLRFSGVMAGLQDGLAVLAVLADSSARCHLEVPEALKHGPLPCGVKFKIEKTT